VRNRPDVQDRLRVLTRSRGDGDGTMERMHPRQKE
jgi:hypothetical protein